MTFAELEFHLVFRLTLLLKTSLKYDKTADLTKTIASLIVVQ